mgnify:CR=1 FL=1
MRRIFCENFIGNINFMSLNENGRSLYVKKFYIKKRIDLSRAGMLCIICIKKVEAEIRKMNNFMNGESIFQKTS